MSEDNQTPLDNYFRVQHQYRGVHIVVEGDPLQAKTKMVEVIAAVDYMLARQAAGGEAAVESASDDKAETSVDEQAAADTAAQDKEAKAKAAAEKKAKAAADKKAKAEADAKARAEAEADDAPDDDADDVAEATEYTLDDLRSAMAEYAQKVGNTKAKALLEEFGAQKLSGLKESDYANVMAKIGG